MEVILGGLTFTGSLMAAGKLQEICARSARSLYKGQNLVNLPACCVVALGKRRLSPCCIPKR